MIPKFACGGSTVHERAGGFESRAVFLGYADLGGCRAFRGHVR